MTSSAGAIRRLNFSCQTAIRLATVHLAPVRYSRDQNESVLVINRIYDSMVAHSNPKVITSDQFRDSVRPWFFGQ